jgi:hypothetical protein
MQKSEIEIGKEYALRESRKADSPLQRIRILQFVRGKKSIATRLFIWRLSSMRISCIRREDS